MGSTTSRGYPYPFAADTNNVPADLLALANAINTDVGTVAAAKLDAATVGNLLTTNQASVETDTTGFSAIAGCTIARTTAQAKVGAASLLVTSTTGASGGGAAGTPRATSGKAVTPGVTYTGIASVLNGVGTRTLQVRLLWWDALYSHELSRELQRHKNAGS